MLLMRVQVLAAAGYQEFAPGRVARKEVQAVGIKTTLPLGWLVG
jgi:hypothetical protein